jgi:hypothetical protein
VLENSTTKEIYLDCYLRVYPWEIKRSNVRRGTYIFVKVALGNVTLYSRKVSLVGVVKEIYVGGRYADIFLTLNEDVIRLRLWPEKRHLIEIKGISERKYVEAYGVLREDRDGSIYVSLQAVRIVGEKYLEDFHSKIVDDRRFLREYFEKALLRS